MTNKLRYTASFFVFLLSIGISCFLLVSLWDNNGWSSYLPATCLSSNCFCEYIRDNSIILQPINAISSFIFCAIGGFLLFYRNVFSYIYIAFSLLFVGIGSFLFHSTLTLWGQFLDVASMYLISGAIITIPLASILKLDFRKFYLMLFITTIVPIIFLYFAPESRRYLFGLLILIGIAIELYSAYTNRYSLTYFISGVSIFSLAFLIWFLDNKMIVCDPHSLLQGHAIWHGLSALALLLVAVHYEKSIALLRSLAK